MAYVFVEVDKTLNGSHSGSSGSTRTTTSSSGVDLRNWVKNILIIGDPIAVLNSGDPDFLPTLAQMYLEGDPDVLESLRDWYPELKPVVENYISGGSAAASTSSGSSHGGSSSTPSPSTHTTSSTTTTTSSGSSHSGSSSSHSGSSGTASTPGTHTTSSSVTTSSTGKDHTGATANTSSGSSHSGSSGTASTPGTHTSSGSTSNTPLDNLQNEYDEEAMRIYQEAMKESNNTSAAIDETPANYNTAQLERKQANYWPYILGGVAAVGLIYLLSRKKKNDKK